MLNSRHFLMTNFSFQSTLQRGQVNLRLLNQLYNFLLRCQDLYGFLTQGLIIDTDLVDLALKVING